MKVRRTTTEVKHFGGALGYLRPVLAEAGPNWAEITFGAITSVAVLVTAGIAIDRWFRDRKATRSARLLVTVERTPGRVGHRVIVSNVGAPALNVTFDLAHYNEKGHFAMLPFDVTGIFPADVLEGTPLMFDTGSLLRVSAPYAVIRWRDGNGEHERVAPLRLPLTP